MSSSSPDASVARAAALVDGAERIVVLAGAGMSTDSGIPDYRGPKGVWTKNPGAERTANIDVYQVDAEVRRRAWQNRADSPMWRAEPNRGHAALVALERRGKLDTLITQNVDGLHQAAGSDPDRIIEVHGTVHDVVCMSCDFREPMPPTLERVRAGEDDPPCLVCGGILKSATISFGQALVPEDLERAFAACETCDLFLAVGTSLAVYPIAHTVATALQNDTPVIIVNAQPTPFDGEADIVIHDAIGVVLPMICETP